MRCNFHLILSNLDLLELISQHDNQILTERWRKSGKIHFPYLLLYLYKLNEIVGVEGCCKEGWATRGKNSCLSLLPSPPPPFLPLAVMQLLASNSILNQNPPHSEGVFMASIALHCQCSLLIMMAMQIVMILSKKSAWSLGLRQLDNSAYDRWWLCNYWGSGSLDNRVCN